MSKIERVWGDVMNFDYIQCGDCLELMKQIPDESIDMILCDLPYGITKNKWDTVIPFNELWKFYERIIKNNGVIALFGDGMFTAQLLKSNPKLWRYNMIWDKQRGCDFLNANIKPLKSHEDIAIFYKHKPTYNKQLWYSTSYKKRKNSSLSDNYGKRKQVYSESKDGARNPLTILSFPRDGNKMHPTQKPLKLLEYLIKTFTVEGEVVLDNCMGAGSTCVAAVNTNRHYIGFELKKKYFDIACQRLDEAKKRIKK